MQDVIAGDQKSEEPPAGGIPDEEGQQFDILSPTRGTMRRLHVLGDGSKSNNHTFPSAPPQPIASKADHQFSDSSTEQENKIENIKLDLKANKKYQ